MLRPFLLAVALGAITTFFLDLSVELSHPILVGIAFTAILVVPVYWFDFFRAAAKLRSLNRQKWKLMQDAGMRIQPEPDDSNSTIGLWAGLLHPFAWLDQEAAIAKKRNLLLGDDSVRQSFSNSQLETLEGIYRSEQHLLVNKRFESTCPHSDLNFDKHQNPYVFIRTELGGTATYKHWWCRLCVARYREYVRSYVVPG